MVMPICTNLSWYISVLLTFFFSLLKYEQSCKRMDDHIPMVTDISISFYFLANADWLFTRRRQRCIRLDIAMWLAGGKFVRATAKIKIGRQIKKKLIYLGSHPRNWQLRSFSHRNQRVRADDILLRLSAKDLVLLHEKKRKETGCRIHTLGASVNDVSVLAH